jgi:type I restriction enzyme M protein
MAKKDNSSFEQKLFKAADKLRKNIDAAEYKHVVLGLIFLKYISESFAELYHKLEADEWSDPEDRDEYIAENTFFVPKVARWSHIQAQAKLPSIGQTIDEAMEAIEKENTDLKNVLPQVYGKANLDKTSLGELIDLISNTELQAENENSKDLFGRVYEYFLGEFANAEGKKGGQFYTPKAIVKLMVEMIEPYKGRVYDPASGSGGMFVMSEKFVTEHSGNIKDITVYGQESNQTTWKLSKMNLAIRNINSKFVVWNTEGTFLKNAHPDLKADFVLANPPFNQKDWGVDILADDARWKYGTPPNGNANYGWMQHMLYHLAPRGVMATVLSNGSLSSNTSGEGDIRKNLVDADLVECIVALPKQLFYNTGIPACLWFLRREKANHNKEVLFIDASELGFMKDRVHRDFAEEHIAIIRDTYHNWRKEENYKDVMGFCKSAALEYVKQHNYVLTPSRYVIKNSKERLNLTFEKKLKFTNNFLLESTKQSRFLDSIIIKTLSEFYPDYKWDNIDFNSNEIIEEMANTFFDEWFAKYKIGNDLPKGWRIGKFGELIEFTNGYAFKSKELFKEPQPNCFKVFKMGDIKKGGGFNPEKTKGYYPKKDNPKLEKYILKNGDLLMSMTDMKDAVSLLGHTALMIYNNDYILNQRVGLIRPKNEISVEYPYLYLLTNSEDFISRIRARANSGVQVNLSTNGIKSTELVIADKETNLSFSKLISPLFHKRRFNSLLKNSLDAYYNEN